MNPVEVASDYVYLKDNYYTLLNKPEFIINDVEFIKKACVYLPELFFERQYQRITTIVRDFLKQFTGDKQPKEIWPGMPRSEYLAAVGLFCYAPYIDLAGRYSEYKTFNCSLKKLTFNEKQFESNVAPYYGDILTRQIEESIPIEILSKWMARPGFARIALLIGRVISNELLTVKPADKPSEMGSPVSLAISDFMTTIEEQKQEIALLNKKTENIQTVTKEPETEAPNTTDHPEIIAIGNTWPYGMNPFSPKLSGFYTLPAVQPITVDGFKEFAQEVLAFIRSKG